MNEKLLLLTDCSLHLGIDSGFILELEAHGLLRTVRIQEAIFIEIVELPNLERMARLHTDLDINLPGIEAISHLLARIESMQDDLKNLHNQLRRYE